MAAGAIATAVIVHSGDSATTKATVGPSASRTLTSAPPRTTVPPSLSPTAPPSSTAPPTTRVQLPQETVTTVTKAPPQAPTAAPTLPVPGQIPGATPPGAALSPQTVVYSVTGTKQMFDLVNVVYTDARGFPVTEFNVALPWTKVVVLNPGVQTESVIATSLYGHLNCSIVNAQGQLVKAATDSGMIATCTR